MLMKQGIDVSFAQGLDTKTDPKRVQIGKFVSLKNSVFTKGGLLQKRNGYGQLASLPDTTYAYLTTLKDNLTAIGPTIAAYNAPNSSWVSRGTIAPMTVNTLPLIRNNLNQTACDSAVAPNGLVCTVYSETDGTTTTIKYAVADGTTGQNITAPIAIPVASGTPTGSARVFVLGAFFVIVFTNVITATSHLQYISVSTSNPATVSANTDIAVSYVSSARLSWDGYVAGSALYIAYNTTSGGQSIKVTKLTNTFSLLTAVTFSTRIATIMSVTADTTGVSPIIWASFYDSAGSTGYTLAVDSALNTVLAPTQIISTGTYLNIASAAQNGVNTVFMEKSNAYTYDSSIATNFIQSKTITQAGTVSSFVTVLRSVGLASKAFIVGAKIYFLSAYSSTYQPSYFLVNGTLSTSAAPVIAGKLAYSNGGGYLATGLPGVTVTGTTAQMAYLFKDLIQAVNKNTAVSATTQVAGVYSQTGVNLGTLALTTAGLDTAEIADVLHISGGFLWMYDGYLPVEHNFFVWPDTDTTTITDFASWSDSGGAMAAKPDGSTNSKAYYYQVTYEWTDNNGNAYRSAPSIPVPVTTTNAGTSGSVTLNIPTLRLTMKTANPVKIVIYRWSVAQQVYYQVTSITAPLLNSTTADQVQFVDTLADASILGNNILYTTGGVVEDVSAPATNLMTLFDTRLWLVDAEDQNLLWYSKQVIEATPVEMSDLFTLYVAPTTAAQGPTGPMKAVFVLDDKLIIFKKNAIYYINGTGPDNTGANNQYSQPIFITATVGCTNQQSIVFQPQGLMFQSDKGIWLLDRNLGTSYIGAPVEDFTLTARVESAQNIPATNQVRFIMDSGVTIVYDYYYDQWSTFSGVPAISSCIYGGLHTFINSYGAAYRESPGAYVDGSNPVLLSFTTGPLRLDALQSYQRAYFFYLLGDYISPHKLNLSVSYDYDLNPTDNVIITPINYSTPYGSGTSQSPYGQGSPYGGPGKSENWRIFLSKQRCMAFAITVEEVFDASYGTVAGAGLTLSGINVVCGFKQKFRPQPALTSAGVS